MPDPTPDPVALPVVGLPPTRWTERQAAAHLGLRAQTLAVWRSTGRHGLPFVKIGGRVRYEPDQVRAWLTSRTGGVQQAAGVA